ncbi:tyrosinase family oxidase copper chaperone [Streptomyces griseoaurantiacus]|uniref:tyrosinase family oxidase copper chaperone n=1 Tax=Streptomyces griseoaurantiacus TaxID=68213 RepID=UPI002E306DEE|nr:tyrosinase family oxidase copper chaperone [Streptomyces jietaisiensis]WTI26867.1 tyrosinase cofactor [Streptomyces jietaisiensis]
MAERTRRDALRALAVTAGALALAPAVTASRCGRTEDLAAGPHATRGGGGGAPADDPTAPDSSAGRPGGPAGADGQRRRFTQTYRGRRIEGTWAAPSRTARDGAGRDPGGGDEGAGRWHITVDGRPLHLMRRADGTWVSMVDHYASYPTPLAAARGAVDVLGPGDHLRAPEPAHDGEHVTAGPPARRPRHTTSEDMTRGTSHDM